MKRYFSALHLLISLLGQVFGGLILSVALIPGIIFLLFVNEMLAGQPLMLRASGLSLAIGMSFFFTGDFLLGCIVLTRRLLRLKNQEQTGDFRSPLVLGAAAHNFLVNLAQSLFLPFVRGTILINLFYQGMGAHIGKRTIITTTRIYDCDLIEIGHDCIIGGNVAINAHTGEGKLGILRKVNIGNYVTIGANTLILPGAIIEDGVMVGANSLVPKDAHLFANKVYGGIPVSEILPNQG